MTFKTRLIRQLYIICIQIICFNLCAKLCASNKTCNVHFLIISLIFLKCLLANRQVLISVVFFSHQIHWNNPLLVSTYEDNSGLTFFMTPNLRQNDAGVFMVGQDYLELEPRRAAVQ